MNGFTTLYLFYIWCQEELRFNCRGCVKELRYAGAIDHRPQSLKINFNFIAAKDKGWMSCWSSSRRSKATDGRSAENKTALNWNMQINSPVKGRARNAECGAEYFQQKPNIYENAKAILRFTPGKLHSSTIATIATSCRAILMWMAAKPKKKEWNPKPRVILNRWKSVRGMPKNRAWIAV